MAKIKIQTIEQFRSLLYKKLMSVTDQIDLFSCSDQLFRQVCNVVGNIGKALDPNYKPPELCELCGLKNANRTIREYSRKLDKPYCDIGNNCFASFNGYVAEAIDTKLCDECYEVAKKEQDEQQNID